MVLYLSTLIFVARYEISRERHEETLTALAHRRKAASVEGEPVGSAS